MVCANSAAAGYSDSIGNESEFEAQPGSPPWRFAEFAPAPRDLGRHSRTAEIADSSDPFDDFEDDDFDDEFDDDFEEDWEDDLTEDEEFPDTFGGADEEEVEKEVEDSPFADDPDFDDA